MSSIDQRVVEMEFRNSSFQKGIQSTLDAVQKLKDGLNFKGADPGKNLNLGPVGSAIDTIKLKFDAMSAAGVAAFATLAAKAVSFGVQMAQNSFKPMMDGFAEYELKMGSIQTILANTARHGTSLETVNSELDSLNKYADKTIYNFAEMTRNASLFTNSGMKIEDAAVAIQGFSNAAAASGTSASGAAGAAYQLTQAMNAGVIRLMDWRSLTNAGMGSKNMQEDLANMASAMGTFEGTGISAKDTMNDFNGSLEKGWLTADVMSEYLKIMANDNYDLAYSQAKAAGMSHEQADALARNAENAFEAATKVRTFSQLIGTIGEAVASGWTESIEAVIGDFTQATELFTGISDYVGEIIGKQADSRNKILKGWSRIGGRNDIIEGFKNIVTAAENIVGPIKKAWDEVFPKKNAYHLKQMTQAFEDFTERIKMGAEGFSKFGGVFKLFFGILKLIIGVVVGVVKSVFTLVGAFLGLGMGVIGLVKVIVGAVAAFGKWLVQTEEAQRVFKALKSLWDNLVGSLKALGDRLQKAGDVMARAFGAIGNGDFSRFVMLMRAALMKLGLSAESAGRFAVKLGKFLQGTGRDAAEFVKKLKTDALSSFADTIEGIGESFGNLKKRLSGKMKVDTSGIKAASVETGKFRGVWDNVISFLKGVGSWIGSFASKFGKGLGGAFEKLSSWVKSLSFEEILALINTGFFIAMYSMIHRFTKSLKTVSDSVGEMFEGFKGVGKTFGETLTEVKDAVSRFGKETAADKIMKIAIALGILAAAVWVLSKIDAKNLAVALGAIAVMLVQLSITLKVLASIEVGEDTKMVKAALALTVMAVAILILASAVKKFEGMRWEDLAKGLVAVSVLLLGLGLFNKFAQANEGSLKASAGLILLAIAIRLLVKAVEDLGTMDPGVLKQGFISLGLIMGGVIALIAVMNGSSGIVKAAAGLLILSAAMMALSLVLAVYAKMPFEIFIVGLLRLGVVLVGLGLAMKLFSGDALKGAAAMAIVAIALGLLVPTLISMGLLPWEVIAKGLVFLGGALLIMAGALFLMGNPTSLQGVLAMTLMSVALYLLIPALISIGMLPWEVIIKGLVGLAGIFVVLALAGLLMAPVVPVIAALAIAILALGIAMLAAGAAMLLFGIGFGLLAAAVVTGGAALLLFFQNLVMMLPLFAQQLGLAVVAFAVVIRDAGPELVGAITTVLSSILTSIRTLTPEFAATFMVILNNMLNVVVTMSPRISAAGLVLIIDFLNKIRSRIGEIVDIAADIIVKFIRGIERNMPDIVDAALDLIQTFATTLISEITGVAPDVINEAIQMGRDMIAGLAQALWDGASAVGEAAMGVAKSAFDKALNFLGIHSPSRKFMWIGKMVDEGFASGIDDHAKKVTKSATGVGHDAIFAMKKAIDALPDLFEDDVESNPRITPILDLSDIQKKAPVLDKTFDNRFIRIRSNIEDAESISRGYEGARNVLHGEPQTIIHKTEVKYEQHNTSPKALSEAEIYRQTKNLTSSLRGAFDAKTS